MHQEILKVGRFDVVLPIGLERPLKTPVRDSYQEFLKTGTNDVRRHLTATATLLPEVLIECRPKRILHAFGGVGATAQIIDQVLPGEVSHDFWERDPELVKYLRQHRPTSDAVHKVTDSFELLRKEPLESFDALLLDMSVGTIKTPGVKPMWQAVERWMNGRRNGFVWFTDTACHKIHLNYKTYAKDFGADVEPSADSYLNVYSGWLERTHGLTITSAMREAGEYYCVVRDLTHKRFTSIGYL